MRGWPQARDCGGAVESQPGAPTREERMPMPPAARPKVLLLEPMLHKAGEALLREAADVEILTRPSREAVHVAIETAAAVWVRYPGPLRGEAIREGRELVIISTSGR